MKELEPFYKSLESNHPMHHYGYQVCRHGNMAAFNGFKEMFSNHLKNKLVECTSLFGENDDFSLEDYHNILNRLSVEQHYFISKSGRTLPTEFNQHPFIVEMIKIAEKNTGHRLKIYNDKLEFRVVRPNEEDNNPLHRDHWFPYFTPLTNIYMPLSGSYCDSALCVVPFSHKWSEDDVKPTFTYEESAKGKKSVKANGVAYSVPQIAECSKEIHIHRPDVLEGDFMLFSPLMVHGGADNSSFATRFSLEIRLERVEE